LSENFCGLKFFISGTYWQNKVAISRTHVFDVENLQLHDTFDLTYGVRKFEAMSS